MTLIALNENLEFLRWFQCVSIWVYVVKQKPAISAPNRRRSGVMSSSLKKKQPYLVKLGKPGLPVDDSTYVRYTLKSHTLIVYTKQKSLHSKILSTPTNSHASKLKCFSKV